LAKKKESEQARAALPLVGREAPKRQIAAALAAGRNVLIEGPVGVGKTYLVQRVLERLGRGVVRVDGDGRYTEQKLTGWFDPPLVLKRGYVAEAFVAGPLVDAMRSGKVLFVNELNRMPEAVQNILLPAMDERYLQIPKLEAVRATDGFAVIATQNPGEFTATHALSEALLDRFEMIRLGYQSRDEEIAIVRAAVRAPVADAVIARAVDLVRDTREHASVRRGASVRAAIAVADLAAQGLPFTDAVLMAVVPRIELVSPEDSAETILRELAEQGGLDDGKKKPG
jgi:MoxR-like ATPase